MSSERGSPVAVSVRDLSWSYGERRALDGVSFEVPAATVFGVLGPNGGGKSTLFKILATLLEPREGRVEVLGFPLPERATEVRRRIGVVFQSPSLDPHLSVVENLTTHGRVFGLGRPEVRDRATALLGRFGLERRGGDRVRTLSGGLKRRVEVAKALLPRPEVLLLDEPSSGLDPAARRDLAELLAGLAADDGVTVLLTTHFIEEADRCHRLMLIDRGHIVAEGSPADLKAAIGGDVVTLRGAEPEALVAALRERLAIEADVVEDSVRFEHTDGAALVGRLSQLPVSIESVQVARPTLEDVFVQRTGHPLEEATQ